MSERCVCRTCRYWNAHSIDMKLGDCMHEPDGIRHRYWGFQHERFGGVRLDSFGPEETKPTYSCHAWDAGPPEPKR